MAKNLSKPKQWQLAASRLVSAREGIEAEIEKYNAALEDLREIQSEYQDALDNLPEGLSGSPYGEKLEAITGLSLDDLEVDFDIVDEVENADLPLGFGRD